MRWLARLKGGVWLTRDTVARWIALTTLASMLTALLLSSLFSLLAGVWARPPLLEAGLMERMAGIARIADALPPEQRQKAADAASDEAFNARWLRQHSEAQLPAIDDAAFRYGAGLLQQLLQRPQARIEAYEPKDWPSPRDESRYVLMIELADGSWMEFSTASRIWGLERVPRSLVYLLLMMISTLTVALVAARYLAAPLERFAQGARRFGVDFRAPPITPEGPQEIRQVIVAFNAMQSRLRHFLDDRTQMLAAISHDLRAPLTRMRLRGEFIEDAEQQAKLFSDVDEMQSMVNSALDFFRDEARLETATAFDLSELLHTIVDDFKDAGVQVAIQVPRRQVYVGRPIAIKRMLVNLLENAVRYGREAQVMLQADDEGVEIRVLDRGPGIPVEQQEAVFAPFYRLEASRNKHTGGVGLGLSAARATVLEHGGRLSLDNRTEGGLEVRVMLPFA
ncbi:ATP-binding protein [Pseudomonas chengduensis]|jgi:signal transduction histidine kinase|uniref:histidine kinase n=1 Tax=Ectopseudomonas chengduensis TaxID=489632 RepID=A0A1G6L6L9_9GAMM|nr:MULTISPECIES: ATP-binding protein [Pseudomonas]KJU77904.1 histidine kinase [Pseudomonas oleovorans]KQO40998.1 histidine kinase [Pseudomonas sp. Leaf83]MBP3061292.1 HAMP domain-containing protein [Pseudomonas chengduensis]MDH1538657.1 ATP-binding protein [Pseudomonas chengduensis]MDH1561761.1 ATP-binding protein [Pseudomonas chengduensis]